MSDAAARTAIVTGAGRGIGAATAERLAHDGWCVVVNYHRDAAAADRTVGRIVADGGRAIAVGADVSDAGAVAALFDTATAAFGAVSALVNNAAVNGFRPLDAIDAAFVDTLLRPNLLGPLLATAEFARRAAASGRVVNISSGAARGALAGSSVYSASKAAIEAVTRCLATELGPRGITVNAVAPGATDTEMFAAQVPDAARRHLVASTILGRLGRPADIASVVAFLCSDDAGWITGQVLDANGGLRS